MIHPKAWVGWGLAALVALSATRNPLHLILLLLCIAVVYAAIGARTETAYRTISPARFALFVIPLAALFNAATAHFGDTVLFRLPTGWPIVGGNVTLEALTFGALNGLVLVGILTAFTTLNRALPIRDLIGLIPRAFYPVALMLSISVTYVPITLRQLEQIREAQAVRGHRVRGLRDWLPLFIPLLVGGLERALQLAEAMTARGFAGGGAAAQDVRARLFTALGLGALLVGWLLRLVWGQEWVGVPLMLAGVGLIVGVLRRLGRRFPRTTYRPTPWTGRDWAIVAGAAVVAIVFSLPGLDRTALIYYPYPKLTAPGFAPLIGIASLGLLGPALLAARIQEERS